MYNATFRFHTYVFTADWGGSVDRARTCMICRKLNIWSTLNEPGRSISQSLSDQGQIGNEVCQGTGTHTQYIVSAADGGWFRTQRLLCSQPAGSLMRVASSQPIRTWKARLVGERPPFAVARHGRVSQFQENFPTRRTHGRELGYRFWIPCYISSFVVGLLACLLVFLLFSWFVCCLFRAGYILFGPKGLINYSGRLLCKVCLSSKIALFTKGKKT